MADAQAYLLLKLAHALAGKLPSALAPAERARVEAVARRQALIEQRILASPEAAGIALSAAALECALADIRGRHQDAAAFADALAGAGLDIDSLRRALARDLCVEAVLERVAGAESPANDTDTELFYHLHPERFRRPERRTLRHILVTVNEALPGSERRAAARRIAAIHARVQASPARFADEALRHSECPSAVHGGLLGTLPRGELYPELEPAAFALRPGEVSAVLESPLGFHVLCCVAVEAAGSVPFAEVRERIRAHLTDWRRARAQKTWLRALLAPPARRAA